MIFKCAHRSVLAAACALLCIHVQTLSWALAQDVKPEANAAVEAASNNKSAPIGAANVRALIGGRVHTQGPLGTIDDGVVIVEGEWIVAVGDSELEIPAGAELIDCAGLELTPGLIDSRSELWLSEPSTAAYANDASLNVLDGVEDFAEDWREVVRQGVTAVYIQPDSRGRLGGYGAVLSTVPTTIPASEEPGSEEPGSEPDDDDEDDEDDDEDEDEDENSAVKKSSAMTTPGGVVVLSYPAALQAALGVGASNNRARKQQFDATKKVFDGALAYKKKWDAYNEFVKKQESSKGGKSADRAPSPDTTRKGVDADKKSPATDGGEAAKSRMRGRPAVVNKTDGQKPEPKEGESESKKEGSDKDAAKDDDKSKAASEKKPEKPDLDPSKELLVQVLDGEIPLRLEIHNSDDAHYAFELLKGYDKLQVVLEGLSDLRSATEKVVDSGLPFVLGPWLESESRFKADPNCTENWGDLLGGNSTVAIATFSSAAGGTRLMRAHLGKAVASGLVVDRALSSVTIDAARVLGVDELIGSIEVGKRADLVAFAGAPLSVASPVQMVWSAGLVAFESPSRNTVKSEQTAALETSERDSSEAKATSAVTVPMSGAYTLKSTRLLQPDGSTRPGRVVIEDGVIVRVDLDTAPADSAEDTDSAEETGSGVVIDVANSLIAPGLFSAHARLNVASGIDPSSETDAGYVVAADAISSGFTGEDRLVSSGMLNALLVPGDSNPLAGSASVLALGSEALVTQRLAATKFVLSGDARSLDRFPSTLAGQLSLVKKSLAGELIDSRLYLPESVASRIDAERESVLKSVASGDRLVLMVAETDAEIRTALRLIGEYQLKAAIVGPTQLEPFVEQLVALDVAVIAKPSRPTDFEWYSADLAKAASAGVKVLFAAENAEQLRLTAALACEAGMTPSDALAAMTYGTAELVGVELMTAGATANLVVWSDTPLSMAATPQVVIVDGVVVK